LFYIYCEKTNLHEIRLTYRRIPEKPAGLLWLFDVCLIEDDAENLCFTMAAVLKNWLAIEITSRHDIQNPKVASIIYES
jgi:hypothetical protein